MIRSFMRSFIYTICVIVIILCIAFIASVKCGLITKTVHVDRYETTCNGELIDTKDITVTDSVDFDINLHCNLFTR